MAAPLTPAQQRVAAELPRLLEPGTPGTPPFRIVCLFASYASPDGDGCRIAHGTLMGEVQVEHAVDLVQMVKALRRVAGEIELMLAGKLPVYDPTSGN